MIVEDYMVWDACSRAQHDFLSRRGTRERIQQFRSGRVTYLIKRDPEERG